MTTHPGAIALRALEPDDSTAIADLFEQTPDAGQITFNARFKIDVYQALTALHPGTVGVVATLPRTGQIVGMALIDLSHRQVEGAIYPCALLNTLKVHPDYRRQGIAAQLAQWRIEYVRQHQGDKAIILADIQKNNVGSQQAARRWCRQFIGEPATVLVRMRDTSPPAQPGITLRAARPEELEAISEQQNSFYREYNLFKPQTAESLAGWLALTAFAVPIRDLYIALDGSGSIVAGAGVTERARMVALHVGKLPLPMQIASRMMRLLPPNGVVDEVVVDQVWFKPGHLAAAQALWQWLRWELRNQGSVLRTAYDPRGPLPNVLQLPFWLPKAHSTFAVQAPMHVDPERLIYPYG